MLIVIHNYSPATLGKQLQTNGLFPNGSLLFPTLGLEVASAFATKWVAKSSEREDERWEAKEKQGIIIFFTLLPLFLSICGCLLEKWVFLEW